MIGDGATGDGVRVVEWYLDDLVKSSSGHHVKVPAVAVSNKYIKRKRKIKIKKKSVMIRDEGKCQYCGIALTRSTSTLDHVVPKSKGGGYSWQNLVTACKKCNQQKGDRLLHETSLSLSKDPKPLTYERYLKLTGECEGPWQEYMS